MVRLTSLRGSRATLQAVTTAAVSPFATGIATFATTVATAWVAAEAAADKARISGPAGAELVSIPTRPPAARHSNRSLAFAIGPVTRTRTRTQRYSYSAVL